MTANRPIEEINVELHKAQNKDMNINIESTINTSVHFLDVTIINENGQLRTSIFHKRATEPYIFHIHHIIHIMFDVIFHMLHYYVLLVSVHMSTILIQNAFELICHCY